MILQVDKEQKTPIYMQITNQVKDLIDKGAITVGQALPSTRNMAKKMGINRSTVIQAYEELQALGYIKSRPGSYNMVQQRRKEAAYNPHHHSIISWKEKCTGEVKGLYEIIQTFYPEPDEPGHSHQGIINFSHLNLDRRLYPADDFRMCINKVLLQHKSNALGYIDYKGYKPLRNYVARRLRLHGISVSEKEILITNGSQQAIDLIIRMLAGKNKKVVIEAPTYSAAIPLLQFSGIEVIEIPMNAHGMDLERLAGVLSKEEVDFVYSIPNFHNPTGITTNHQHRERLYGTCARYRTPLVEDGFEEDMKYFGKVDLPIKSIDEDNIVIYLGTFSKTLFPGLRIGWITADKEFIDIVSAIKRFSDLSSGSLAQVALHRFCTEGYYDLHLRRIHRVFRKRMQTALTTMEKSFPPAVEWTRPLGGYTIWIKLPGVFGKEELNSLLYKFGVVVSHGSYYFCAGEASAYFRLSISQLDEEEIAKGIKRLGKALYKLI